MRFLPLVLLLSSPHATVVSSQEEETRTQFLPSRDMWTFENPSGRTALTLDGNCGGLAEAALVYFAKRKELKKSGKELPALSALSRRIEEIDKNQTSGFVKDFSTIAQSHFMRYGKNLSTWDQRRGDERVVGKIQERLNRPDPLPVRIALVGQGGGHAILAYDYTDYGDRIVVRIADVNYPGDDKRELVHVRGKGWTPYDGYDQVGYIRTDIPYPEQYLKMIPASQKGRLIENPRFPAPAPPGENNLRRKQLRDGVGGVLVEFDRSMLSSQASKEAWNDFYRSLSDGSKESLILEAEGRKAQLAAVSLSQVLQSEGGTLGRLVRIRGYVIQEKDILLVGEASESSFGPRIRTDHLVVALRNTWQQGRFPFVSLDPDPESGRQRVRVGGILDELRETEFVKILLDADHQMKRIFCGEESSEEARERGIPPLNISGFRTWFDLLCEQKPTQATRSRWWFYPVQSKLSFVWDREKDGVQAALFDSKVQVLTMERLEVGGDVMDAERREPVAEEAADLFTRHFDDLASRYGIFRELNVLFDLVKLCAIWRFKGIRHPVLDELCKRGVEKIDLPRSYEGIGPKRVPGTLLGIRGGADSTVRRSNLTFRDGDHLAGLIQAKSGEKVTVDLPSRVSLDETVARRGVAEWMVEEARECLERLELEEAEGMFSSALENDPSSADATVGRAVARYQQGKLPAALEDFRKAREEIPYLQALEAVLLAYVGRKEEASAQARKAVEAYPKHPAVLGWSATALLHAHEFAEAERVIEHLCEVAPSSSRAYDLRSMIDLLRHLGPAEGKRRLDLIRRIPPAVMNAYDDGVVRMRRFDIVGAAASFELCLGLIERAGNHSAVEDLRLRERCHLGMATVLASGVGVYRHVRPDLAGDCAQDARKHAEKIVELHPEWRTGYFAAVLAGIHAGREVGDLILLYDKALEQDPTKDPLHQELSFALGTEKAAAYYGLLLAYKSMGDAKRATSLLEKVLPLLGDGISAEIVRLFLKLRTSRPDAALPELRSLHDRIPDPLSADPVTLWCVGFFYTVLLQVEGKYGAPEVHLEKQALKYLRISQISGMNWDTLTQTCAFRLAVASRLSHRYEELFRGHPNLKKLDWNSTEEETLQTLRSVREELRFKARTEASPFLASFVDFGLRTAEMKLAETMRAKLPSEDDPLERMIDAAETEADLRTASLFADLLAQGATAAAESGEDIPAALRDALARAYAKAARRTLPRSSAVREWSGWTTAPDSPNSPDTPKPPSSKPRSPPRRIVWPFLAGIGAVLAATAGGVALWFRGRRGSPAVRRSSVRAQGPKRRE